MATSPMSMMMGGGKLNSPGPSGPTPGPGSSPSFSPSSLMGEEEGPGGPEQANADSDLSLVQEIRTMEQTLQSVASRYPNAASTVRRAITSIRDVLKQVVSGNQGSTPGEEEPPAPSTTA